VVIGAIPVAAKITQHVWVSFFRRGSANGERSWRGCGWRFAADSSQGYPEHNGRYLEHLLGGRERSDGWGVARPPRRRVPHEGLPGRTVVRPVHDEATTG
jgi:hypothetical protein